MSRKSMLLLAFIFTLILAAHQVGAVVGADWPSVRHDGGLTGQSPLKGGLGQAPGELWSVDLGGPSLPMEYATIQDVNGDGKNEVLRPMADRLVCQDLTGKKLWEVDKLQNPIVKDIRDYAGDGGRGLLTTYTKALSTVYLMIDGRTGKSATLFSTHDVFGGTPRTGHLLPGVKGQQYCFPWSGGEEEAWVHLFSFEKGVAHPTRRLYAYEKAMIYAPLHVFVDVDGDGQNEFVMLSHEQLWAWDLKTWERKFYTTWVPKRHRIRSYMSYSGMMPLKPGQLPSLLEISMHIPGVEVVTQDGKGHSKLLWRKLVWKEEYQYQQEVKIVAGAPNPFMDIDGDGQIEMMVAVTNEHGDALQHLVIWGADRGDRLFDEPGYTVLGNDDLDGDGKMETILKRGDTLSIANFNGKTFVERWQSKTAEPLFVPTPPEGDLRLMCQGFLCNRTFWREKAGSSNFLMKIDGKVYSCKLTPGGSLDQVSPIERHEALGNLQDPPKLNYTWDGATLKTTVDGKEVVGYKTPYHRAYLAPPPVTATLGGEMRTLVRGNDSSLMSISATGKDVRKLAEKLTNDTSYAITDLDGDGQNEVIASVTDSDGKPAVQILDGAGKLLKSYYPAAEGGSFVLGPTGSLGSGNGRWFALMVRNPFTRPLVIAYDGKTGREITRRTGYGVYDAEPSQFVLHIPTAVYDYNGDGADDMICLSENFCGIIDVAHDKDLVDPLAKTMLSDTIPGHWTAYATPSVMPDPATGKFRLALSRSYAMTMLVIDPEGWPIWHMGAQRDATQRNLVGLGDLDGDGKTELVSARQDGLLTAFDWDATNEKCFRCPPDAPLDRVNHAGKIRWTFNLATPPISDFASADLDGDGKTELLCGAGDGKLYALKEKGGKCSILWSVDLKQTVGAPTIADINGDGKAEILVTSEDGTLHCLGAK
jgi:outer membrane protein assembly factor BamB